MNRYSPYFRLDLFKLGAIGLLVLLALWLALGALRPVPSEAALPLPATPTGDPPSSTPLPASDTPTPSPTLPLTSAGEAEPTTAPGLSPTPGQAAATAQAEVACPLALPTRLKVGARVRVLSTLHIRSAPEISGNLIQTNSPGTELEITGGPVCVPYESGAHLWWEVTRPDGITGWSAEGAANGSAYFMEPVQP
jgi:hypothetical protein